MFGARILTTKGYQTVLNFSTGKHVSSHEIYFDAPPDQYTPVGPQYIYPPSGSVSDYALLNISRGNINTGCSMKADTVNNRWELWNLSLRESYSILELISVQ